MGNLGLLLLTLLALSIPAGADRPDREPLLVFVGIPPLAGFAERVGGEHVNVHVLMKPGENPQTFAPTPRQMSSLSRAQLYLQVDLPFEHELVGWIEGNCPQTEVIDVGAGVERRAIAPEHEGHHHREAEPDPHIWMSPPLMRRQATNIQKAFAQADPEFAAVYARNLEAFLAEIDATHDRIQTLLAPYHGRAFYVFHPAFGYFGDTYGLEQRAVELGGKSPTPRQVAALIGQAKADGVRIIFVQPQFDRHSAEAVAAAIDGAVIPIDALARDVLANLEEIAGQLEQALTAESGRDAANE